MVDLTHLDGLLSTLRRHGVTRYRASGVSIEIGAQTAAEVPPKPATPAQTVESAIAQAEASGGLACPGGCPHPIYDHNENGCTHGCPIEQCIGQKKLLELAGKD